MMTKQEEVSLREYIDTRIKALEDRFVAIDRSTDLAAAAVMARLESMNEFRTQLNSQASHFVTRSEIDSKMDAANAVHAEYDRRIQLLEQNKLNTSAHDVLEKRIQTLEQSISNIQGRMLATGVGFTVVATIISIALHFIK